MATREGIYVGGHEIVQRYVGNKLVWEKNKYILLGTNNDGNWNSVGSTEAKRYSTNKRPELYNKETLERVVMIKVETETFFPSKVTSEERHSHTDHDAGWTTRVDNYYDEVITFKNPTDRDNFIMIANRRSDILYYGRGR
jgi:hypothetical protein|nr:MAG TPA: hypothetical protein [Caudoviricetes sp.]